MSDLTLKDMFAKIEEYQVSLGYDVKNMSDQEKLEYARACSLAMYQEVGELVDSFPFKPWRKTEDQPMDIPNMEREGIDIILFLSHILRCFNISAADLEARFPKVITNNNARIQNGYSKVNTQTDKMSKEQ